MRGVTQYNGLEQFKEAYFLPSYLNEHLTISLSSFTERHTFKTRSPIWFGGGEHAGKRHPEHFCSEEGH